MPVISSNYKAPWLLKNPHLQTIFPYLFRQRPKLKYSRIRINTNDNDFLDLDFLLHKTKTNNLVIICHGLESSSETGNELSLAQILFNNNYDVLAMNYRGCSGTTNKSSKTYHSGKSEDLKEVIEYVSKNFEYENLYLVGFSIGGNIVLKYLGENTNNTVKKAVALSSPLNLACSANQMAQSQNYVYMKYFLLKLYRKMKVKALNYPELTSIKDFHKLKNFHDFDGRYTAPLNGFKSAEDYWEKASSKSHLKSINTPTLILSSADDSFLGANCYPYEVAKENKNLFLEITEHGGHVGFIEFNQKNIFYHERRVLEFFNKLK